MKISKYDIGFSCILVVSLFVDYKLFCILFIIISFLYIYENIKNNSNKKIDNKSNYNGLSIREKIEIDEENLSKLDIIKKLKITTSTQNKYKIYEEAKSKFLNDTTSYKFVQHRSINKLECDKCLSYVKHNKYDYCVYNESYIDDITEREIPFCRMFSSKEIN